MIVLYRGHTIEAKRQRSLSGALLVFYAVWRTEDSYEVDSGYSYSSEKISQFVEGLKRDVDRRVDGLPHDTEVQ